MRGHAAKRSADGTVTGPVNGTAGQDRRPRVLASGVLAVLLCVVVVHGLTDIFVPGAWQWQVVVVFGVTVLVSAGVAALGPPGRENRALLCGVGAGMVGWIALVVRNGRAGEWLGDPSGMFGGAAQTVNTASTPFAPVGPVEDVMVTVGLLLATAVASILVGVGTPFAAGGILSLLLILPPAVTGIPVDRPLLAAAGVLLILLAWTSTPRFSVPGLALAAVAGVVSLVVVSAMPDAPDRSLNPSVVMSLVNRSVPDVTVSLADDLRKGSNTRVFSFTTVDTGGPEAHYFTLATLADFEAGHWTVQDAENADARTVDEPRADAAPGTRTVDVTLDGLRSEWLPLPQGAHRVTVPDGVDTSFDPGKWTWREESATARADRAVTRDGDRYAVEASPLTSAALGGGRVRRGGICGRHGRGRHSGHRHSTLSATSR